MKDVWAVCTRLPDQSLDAWELNGIYDSRDEALAACTDDKTHAARFQINRSYRGVFDFEIIDQAHPGGVMTSAPRTSPENCQQVLREQGKSYPRTCQVCRFGPCQRV